MAAVAPTLVEAIYGGKWAGAERLLLPLALAMPVHASMTGSGLLWARSRVATELKVEAGTVVMFIVGLAMASRISMQAIAWAVLAVYVLRAFWLTSRILDSIQLSWKSFFGAARGGLFLGAITAGTFYVVNISLMSEGMSSLNRLCMLAGVGLVIVTLLPVCVRGVIASTELRSFLERATPPSPGLLQTVIQMYARPWIRERPD